jgi:hypothetical protein
MTVVDGGSETTAICNCNTKAVQPAKIINCRHIISCIKCFPVISPKSTCSFCGEEIQQIEVVSPDSEQVLTLRYLGIGWQISVPKNISLESHLSSVLSVHPKRMRLLLSGTAYEGGEFKKGFEESARRNKTVTLVATPLQKHDQIQRIETIRTNEERVARINGTIDGIRSFIINFIETIWLFFASIFRPYTREQLQRAPVTEPTNNPHEE